MGLGKTLCALACCNILNDKRKILIVAPNSLKLQWQKEINRLGLGTVLVASKASDLSFYDNQRFLILSYELLNRHRYILDQKYDILIADEIQRIKNSESVAWETLSLVKTEFIFSLSGTPIQNNISDLLSLINFLNPNEIKPEWKFYEDFCLFSKAKLFGIKPNKTEDLKKRFAKYIINPKVDYSKFKLPKKEEVTFNIPLNSDQTQLINGYMGIVRPLIAKSMNYPLTVAEKAKLNGLLTLALMVSADARLVNYSAKESDRFLFIQDKIKEVVNKGEKIVIYSSWIKALVLLEPFLKENNIGYTLFTGELSVKRRNKNLTDFIEEDDVKVMLSTDSGGQGIDGLQLAANNILHIEQIWNPSKIDQRNGRLVRYLQKKDVVNVYNLTSNSEIEHMVSEAHIRKYSTITSIMN